MNILSLFDWISCGRVALERAGIQVDKYFASEVDKYAIQIAKKNHPDTIHIGSVTDVLYCDWTIYWSDLSMMHKDANIDMIIWWSPCQDLSIAKKDGKWLQWEKSSLFFEYVRILKEVKPKYFLLENVASMKKADKEEITRVLTEVYPDVQWYLINSALLAAQNRKRLYWTNIQWVEQPEDRGILLKDILEETIDEKFILNNEQVEKMKLIKWSKTFFSWKKEWSIEFPMSTDRKSLTVLTSESGLNRSTNCIQVSWVALRNRWEWKKPEFNGTEKANSMTTVQTDSMVFVANQFNNRIFTDKTGTLWTWMWRTAKQWLAIYKDEISEKWFIRKLTPIECERLQTLPDNYTEWVSNTQRYKAIWNWWTVDIIAHIFSYIK